MKTTMQDPSETTSVMQGWSPIFKKAESKLEWVQRMDGQGNWEPLNKRRHEKLGFLSLTPPKLTRDATVASKYTEGVGVDTKEKKTTIFT